MAYGIFRRRLANVESDRIILGADDGRLISLHDRAYPQPLHFGNPRPAAATADDGRRKTSRADRRQAAVHASGGPASTQAAQAGKPAGQTAPASPAADEAAGHTTGQPARTAAGVAHR